MLRQSAIQAQQQQPQPVQPSVAPPTHNPIPSPAAFNQQPSIQPPFQVSSTATPIISTNPPPQSTTIPAVIPPPASLSVSSSVIPSIPNTTNVDPQSNPTVAVNPIPNLASNKAYYARA